MSYPEILSSVGCAAHVTSGPSQSLRATYQAFGAHLHARMCTWMIKRTLFSATLVSSLPLATLLIGCGGNVSAISTPVPAVSIGASPISIAPGSSSTLTVTATNATQVTVTGTDGSTYSLTASGGTQTVSPTATTTYTAAATGAGGNASATATVTVSGAGTGGAKSVDHVIFMLQENHTFDNYFGMLNPYRKSNGWNIGDDGVTYDVDGDFTIHGVTKPEKLSLVVVHPGTQESEIKGTMFFDRKEYGMEKNMYFTHSLIRQTR